MSIKGPSLLYHQGWVELKDGFGPWKRFWLVLRANELLLYKTGSKGETASWRHALDPGLLINVANFDGRRDYQFHLTSAGKKFRCASENDRDLWVAYIVGLAKGDFERTNKLLPGQATAVQGAIQCWQEYQMASNVDSSNVDEGIGSFSEFSDCTSGEVFTSGGPIRNHKFYEHIPGQPRNQSHPTWFFENCSRQLAEKVLDKGREYGNVLMRESVTFKDNGSYVLSLRRDTPGRSSEYEHFEVVQVAAGYQIRVENIHDPCRCLQDVMNYFTVAAGASYTYPFTSNNLASLGLGPHYQSVISMQSAVNRGVTTQPARSVPPKTWGPRSKTPQRPTNIPGQRNVSHTMSRRSSDIAPASLRDVLRPRDNEISAVHAQPSFSGPAAYISTPRQPPAHDETSDKPMSPLEAEIAARAKLMTEKRRTSEPEEANSFPPPPTLTNSPPERPKPSVSFANPPPSAPAPASVPQPPSVPTASFHLGPSIPAAPPAPPMPPPVPQQLAVPSVPVAPPAPQMSSIPPAPPAPLAPPAPPAPQAPQAPQAPPTGHLTKSPAVLSKQLLRRPSMPESSAQLAAQRAALRPVGAPVTGKKFIRQQTSPNLHNMAPQVKPKPTRRKSESEVQVSVSMSCPPSESGIVEEDHPSVRDVRAMFDSGHSSVSGQTKQQDTEVASQMNPKVPVKGAGLLRSVSNNTYANFTRVFSGNRLLSRESSAYEIPKVDPTQQSAVKQQEQSELTNDYVNTNEFKVGYTALHDQQHGLETQNQTNTNRSHTGEQALHGRLGRLTQDYVNVGKAWVEDEPVYEDLSEYYSDRRAKQDTKSDISAFYEPPAVGIINQISTPSTMAPPSTQMYPPMSEGQEDMFATSQSREEFKRRLESLIGGSATPVSPPPNTHRDTPLPPLPKQENIYSEPEA